MYDVSIDVFALTLRPALRLNIFKGREIAVETDLTPTEARRLAIELLRKAELVAARSDYESEPFRNPQPENAA